jgi:hypothetical protein
MSIVVEAPDSETNTIDPKVGSTASLNVRSGCWFLGATRPTLPPELLSHLESRNKRAYVVAGDRPKSVRREFPVRGGDPLVRSNRDRTAQDTCAVDLHCSRSSSVRGTGQTACGLQPTGCWNCGRHSGRLRAARVRTDPGGRQCSRRRPGRPSQEHLVSVVRSSKQFADAGRTWVFRIRSSGMTQSRPRGDPGVATDIGNCFEPFADALSLRDYTNRSSHVRCGNRASGRSRSRGVRSTYLAGRKGRSDGGSAVRVELPEMSTHAPLAHPRTS